MPNPEEATPSVNDSGRRPILALTIAIVALGASLVTAARFPLIDPDEGRNAEVGREMLTSGDLVIPHLAGMPYLDKPPALFWAEALAMRFAGPTPAAARLPAALAAFATLLVLISFGARRAADGDPLRIVALLAAAPLFSVLSAYVIFDMPLTLCVTIVWTGVADEIETPHALRRLCLFAAVALGVLLKGPVMLAWGIGGSAMAALLLRSRSPLKWLAWWPGWLLVLLVAGGWFTLASVRYPEYPHYAFLEESLERMTQTTFHRNQPWWFVPAVLVGGAMPWSLATPWWRRPPHGVTRSDRVAIGFLLFAVVFFTCSRSKLVTYLLPALAPMAWLAAPRWNDSGAARWGGTVAGVLYGAMAGGMALLGLAAAGLGANFKSVDLSIDRPIALLLAGAFACAAIVCALGALWRRPGLALTGTLAFFPLVFLAGGPLLESYAHSQSGAPLGYTLASLEASGRVRFESCYSPGADFVLGQVSQLDSLAGMETGSNYQARYRDLLRRRGEWTPVTNSASDGTEFVVRRAGRIPPDREWGECFHDRQFVAYFRRPSKSGLVEGNNSEKR